MDRYLVISSDCHAGLPPEQYRAYLDSRYREAFDAALPIQIEMTERAAKKFLVHDINVEWRKGHEEGIRGAWDSDVRNRVLDSDGVAGEVIFPDGITEMNMPPFGAGLGLPTQGIDPELQWAGARAHNRWISEFCQMAPERRAGLAIVPMLWDVNEAVKEVRWARAQGLRGIMIPTRWVGQDGYHDPKYDPVWDVCQELEMVVNIHSGAAPMEDYGDHPGMMGIYISEVAWYAARPAVFMIWGGVFERFPRLRLMISEATSIWVPELLALLDFRYEVTHFAAKLGDYRSHLRRRPSEYFRDCVSVGASCMPQREVELRHEIGLKNICWATDYPHPEGSWPVTREQMIDIFSGVPEADLSAMRGANCAELFGFDVEKLAPLVARIGPEKSLFA
jgi:predicted TIM-barrel fold metal-dependent hydrolase